MRGGGNMLNPENSASSNFASPGLKEWVSAEYEAGYAARFADASESLTATHCWRVGWEDANTELSECARQNRLIAEGIQTRNPNSSEVSQIPSDFFS